jgi:hypothetical protein
MSRKGFGMGRRLVAIALGCVLALAGAACGGEGADPFPTALPTAEAIDPAVLSQAVLRDGDLPESYTTETSIGSPGSVGVLASSVSSNGTVEIQVTTIWMPTIIDAEQSLARQRGVWIGLGWKERNDELQGMEAAFRYTKPGSGLIELAIENQFVLSLTMTPTDPNAPDLAAEDEAEFGRLIALLAERVSAIQAGEVTPVAGTPEAAT